MKGTTADSPQSGVISIADKPVIDREELYQLVWAEPMLQVAKRFGVSSSYLARICTRLNVPRPARGYWAKLAAGKMTRQEALPEAQPGDLPEWRRDGTLPRTVRILPKPPAAPPRKQREPSRTMSDTHPVLRGARPLFEAGRLSWEGEYLKPNKRLLVDLAVTAGGIDKALSFANKLFLAFEARGHRVTLAPPNERLHRAAVDEREHPGKSRNFNNLWSPMRCTVVYIGTVAIGLTIIELSERAEARRIGDKYVRLIEIPTTGRGRSARDHGWTMQQTFPTGRLCLQAYSPYPGTNWVRQWSELKPQDLPTKIRTIIRELEASAAEIAGLVEEAERAAEVERQRREAQWAEWKRKEAERRAEKAVSDSRKELQEVIEVWAETRRIENFFADAERRTLELPPEDRARVVERLQRARELIGKNDPLERLTSWRAPDER